MLFAFIVAAAWPIGVALVEPAECSSSACDIGFHFDRTSTQSLLQARNQLQNRIARKRLEVSRQGVTPAKVALNTQSETMLAGVKKIEQEGHVDVKEVFERNGTTHTMNAEGHVDVKEVFKRNGATHTMNAEVSTGIGVLLGLMFLFLLFCGPSKRREPITFLAAAGSSSQGGHDERPNIKRLNTEAIEEEHPQEVLQTKSGGSTPLEVTDEELAEFINGDEERLNILTRIACCLGGEEEAKDIVERCSAHGAIKLAEKAKSEVEKGIVLLAQLVQAFQLRQKQKAENDKRTPRQKFVDCMRQVRLSLRYLKNLKDSIKTVEQGWTDNSDLRRSTANKYEARVGRGSVMYVEQKNANEEGRQSHSVFNTARWSERWLDVGGIALIFCLSQVVGLAYAFYLKRRFPKMYEFMGPWVLVSRGEAMSLIFISVLMPLSMSRGLVTKLRPFTENKPLLENMVDKHVLMHRYMAVMLPIFAFLHILGHFLGSIPAIMEETDNDAINEAFTDGTKIRFNFMTWQDALLCWPAVTGFSLVLILILFWALSNEGVRRWSFELFHYPHLVLISLWCSVLILHGARQWLGCGIPLGMLCVAPPTLFFCIERFKHVSRAMHPAIQITSAVTKKRQIMLEMNIKGSSYEYVTGMYCMVRVPEISSYQWHPFTIASGGGDTVRIICAVVGDFTTSVRDLLIKAEKDAQASGGEIRYPEINLRGGYGAPAASMERHKHIVMVGAGVGATPFLSFLSNVCDSAKKDAKSQFDNLESATFYWVTREPDDFVWVNRYMATIAAEPKLASRITLKLCLTKTLETSTGKNFNSHEIAIFWLGAQIAVRAGFAPETVRSLGVPTRFGRPDWVKELRAVEQRLRKAGHTLPEGSEVCVFACGNSLLVESLSAACEEVQDGISFRLFAEQF